MKIWQGEIFKKPKPMKTAEIKNLYVIDGKELQRKIDELNKEILYFEDSTYAKECGKVKQELQKLQQSLSPLESVLEKAFNDGREGYHNANETVLGLEVYSEYEYPTFQHFLNKPIEL